MWFWWFIMVCDMLIPITMIIGGRLMWMRCPKDINSLSGYRTSRSMKNMDTWRFAHSYIGRLWWLLGLILLVPTVMAHIPFYNADDDLIGIVSLIVLAVHSIILIASIFYTERALKRRFNDDGSRKEL